MRKFYLLSTLVLSILYGRNSFAQDFSNKGKDFWVAYGYHAVMTPSGGAQEMVLYFAAEQTTNVQVTIPGVGYLASYVVPANSVITSAPIPKNGPLDARLTAESISPENKGIHIISDKPIVAYAHIYNASVSGASILFPTNTLGKEYYSVNYTNISNSGNANCWAYVIAADTGTTTIEITPSANTINHPAGVPFTITMTQGQVYNLMGQLTSFSNPFRGVDLTGTKIESIASASGSCKKIAVFSGSGRISITCNNSSSSSDNYMVQDFPRSAWGKRFLTVQAAGNQSVNIYRVCVSDPTTVVRINGAVTGLPLQNGFFYEIPATSQPQLIEADKPITVAQYFTSQGACGNGSQPGDPEVIYLSPVEQNINKVLWNATPNFAISTHYFNVVIPNTGTAVSSFLLDGVPPGNSFIPHPQDPAYVYLQQSVSPGAHVIQSDSGFNAIAYGFGSAESYGYNAGTNIKDIFQFVSIQNQFATVNFPATCRNSPFTFSMTFPYQPTRIEWLFGTTLNGMGIADVVSFNGGAPLVPTSTVVVAGKTLYVYQLPGTFSIPNAGTYSIRVNATNPTPDGCAGVQEIDYDLEVFERPVADFNFSDVCFPTPVAFTDISNTGGRPATSRYWNFGDATTGSTNNPTHAYAAPGAYNVRYSLITDVGCISDTASHVVTVSPVPTATITGAIQVCVGDPPPNVTFTGATGTAPYTFTYNINGGPNQTVVTTSGNSVTAPVSTGTPGTYTYNLVSVGDASPALCNQPQTGSVVVQVNTSASASISGGITVCIGAPSPSITFTGSSGGTPYTFTYNINGGANQTITTVSGNSITVAVPTTTAGVFNYNLVSVQGGSSSLCSQVQTGTATVTVSDLPSASISGTTEACLNGTPPVITFTGAAGSAPYTFTYNINGGPNQTITTVSGSAVTIPASTVATGTFTYNLVSVVEGSSNLCSQAQTGSATVVVNPLPTADFSVGTPACETKAVGFTDLSVPNAGVLNGWSWNFGDATTSNLQNPTHTFTTAGTYNVTLSVTTDKGCVSNPVSTRPVVVSINPEAGFIIPQACVNDLVLFTDTSKITSPANITGWAWNFGDPASGPLNTSTIQNGTHLFSGTGPFTVTQIVYSNTGCSDTIQQSIFINGMPVSDFSVANLTTLCANDSISITDLSIVNPGNVTRVEIYWDNVGAPGVFQTDNSPGPGKIYKHLYPNFQAPLTRTFDIRFRAYSGTVCVNDRIRTITVNAAPLVQFNSIPAACLDAAPFQITQATEIGGVPGNGVFSGPGVSPTGIFDPASVGAGTYMIRYTFTSTASGCVDTLSRPVTVLDSASARFTYSTQVCDRTPVAFNSTTSVIPAASGTIVGWSWDFGDPASGAANISSTQNPSHLFSGWGTYNVTLNVITSNGCRSTVRTIPVYVNPKPVSNFTIPGSACLPSANITFNNISTIPDGTQSSFSYLWNFGDPASGILNTSTGSSPSHIYNSAGPFNVNLQVTSGAGCVHDTTFIVNNIHPEPTGAFNVDRTDICIGQTFTFTDNSNPADGTTTQWSWNMDDGNTRSTPSFTYTYPAAGVYDVTLFITNSHGCRSSIATRTVTVNAYPLVNAGPDLFILEDGSDTLNPVITATNPTYLWTPNMYFIGSNTVRNAIVKGVADITYTLTVTGQGGCVGSDEVFIKVLKGPEIPNIFSPNGDGIHDKWEIKYLDTYPEGTVEIFNRYGQLIFRSVGYGTPWDGTVNGKQVPMGTYYYIVNPKNGRKIMSGYVDVIR